MEAVVALMYAFFTHYQVTKDVDQVADIAVRGI